MNKLQTAIESLAARLDGRLRLQYREQTDSTSSLLRELAMAGGLSQPTLIATDDQQTGRGTRGRGWQMQPGRDLAFSLGLPLYNDLQPSERLPLALSVLIAQSLANQIREQWRAERLNRDVEPPDETGRTDSSGRVLTALNNARDELAGRICAVKWPNDLLLARQMASGELEYRKCGGILVETTGQSLLIGIGINVNSRAVDFGPGLSGSLNTLRDCSGFELDREALFTGLVLRLYGNLVFSGILQGFCSADDSAIRALEPAWHELDRTAGQRWLLLREGLEIPVVATHVDFASGNLHVTDETGNNYVVHSYRELQAK